MYFIPLLAASLSALYATLDPTSVSQHFAFYELYPKSSEGRQALKHAWELLSGGCNEWDPELILPSIDPQPLIQFVNRSGQESAPLLNEEQLAVIEKLSRHLLNRELGGFGLWDEEALLGLPVEQIDLARGLLLAELGSDVEARLKIRSYEANLDLMALQILARLGEGATGLEKVRAINDYIFSEMRFRSPPHSLHAKEIDVYTFCRRYSIAGGASAWACRFCICPWRSDWDYRSRRSRRQATSTCAMWLRMERW